MEVLVRVPHQAVDLPLGCFDSAGLVARAPHARGSGCAVLARQSDLPRASVARGIAATRFVVMVMCCRIKLTHLLLPSKAAMCRAELFLARNLSLYIFLILFITSPSGEPCFIKEFFLLDIFREFLQPLLCAPFSYF